MWGSRDPFLEFWDPPDFSVTVEARNFKFGKETDGSEFLRRKCKMRSKRVMWRSRDPLLEFWDPPNISGTVETINFKFGIENDDNVY